MPPAKLGLVYGHTGLRKFLDTVGLARTKELFLTGRNFTAERAEEIGLVHEVVADERLEKAAVELAAAIAANAPLSMRGNKQRDRPAQRLPHPDRAAGGRPDRPARVLLRLRGPARGHPRLRREAQARVEGTVSAKARKALAAADPTMAALIERIGEIDLETRLRRRSEERPADAYGALLRAIVGQQLSTKAARTIYLRVLDLFDGTTPSPEQLLEAERGRPARRRALRPQGRVRPRPRLPRARAASWSWTALDELSDEEAIEEIVAVRGLGRWTAEMFLLFHLERPDVLSGGDLGIRKAVQVEYGLEEMPAPERVLEIGEPWRPHRSLASLYLWESLANVPAE